MPPHEHGPVATDAAVQRVVNATGVVLDANLGRAPLSAAARAAVAEAAGYTTVGLDLATGRRTSRAVRLGAQLAAACGTEAATAVNNGAGAVLLALAALAGDREVVASRGELLELGGSYRLTDTAEAAGVRLVEAGTTNRTRLDDYRAAIGTDSALLLKVHRAGYTLGGSTEEVAPPALVELGRQTGLPVVHVVGSGLLASVDDGPLASEPSVAASVAAGVDLVVFSADKLLGGPQAGVLAGRADLVLRLRRHPLARALELDKLRIAALAATLASHRDHPSPVDLPTVAMLSTDPAMLRQRAEWMAHELGSGARAVAVSAPVGSGTLPGVELPSWAVEVACDDAGRDAAGRDAAGRDAAGRDAAGRDTAGRDTAGRDTAGSDAAGRLVERLRAGTPPVIARRDGDGGRVLLDLRTVPPSQDAELVDLVLAAQHPPA